MPAHRKPKIKLICDSCRKVVELCPADAAQRGDIFCCSRKCQGIWSAERFFRKTQPGFNGCILWTKNPDKDGYGKFRVEGNFMRAHRYSWELTNGTIPDGLHVLHHCDNPPCVNPNHLFLGTAIDNVADKVAKGRQAIGEQNGGGVKLTEEQVVLIRIRYAIGGISQKTLADEYNVSSGLIGHIVRRRNWKYLL